MSKLETGSSLLSQDRMIADGKLKMIGILRTHVPPAPGSLVNFYEAQLVGEQHWQDIWRFGVFGVIGKSVLDFSAITVYAMTDVLNYEL